MSYRFQINGETYIGRSVPGASRMEIFHYSTGRFIVAFDPDVHSLRGRRPWGSWAHIQPDTDLGLLETLQPALLSVCRRSLESQSAATN